jgi:CheY-like chemotaxis protein
MKHVLFIMNERALREYIKEGLADGEYEFTECGTAVQALKHLIDTPFHVIVLEARMFPGMASGDPVLSDMAAMLPQSRYNEMLLHWQVACRTMQLAREPDSANRRTPFIIKFPLDAESVLHGSGDMLNPDAVRKDLLKVGLATPLFEARAKDVIEAISRIP